MTRIVIAKHRQPLPLPRSTRKASHGARMLILATALSPSVILAQSAWKPDRPVELVVAAAPGGANDRIGRAVQRVLQDMRLANPVQVVNKPGGGQAVAFSYLNTHSGNPHYLGLASSSWLTTIAGGRGTITHRDVTPVVKFLDEYQLFFVRADAPFKNAREIVDYLKKDPASVSFGFSTSAGNPSHIGIAMLARQAGADARKVKAVVFNSGTDTAVQVAGGHLDVGVQSPGSAARMAEAGKIRIIAVAAPQRHPGALAHVPTLREQGINVDVNVFYTIFGPRGMDTAAAAYWDQAVTRVMQSDTVKKDLELNFWTIDIVNHKELPGFLQREHDSYRRVLTEMGLYKPN